MNKYILFSLGLFGISLFLLLWEGLLIGHLIRQVKRLEEEVQVRVFDKHPVSPLRSRSKLWGVKHILMALLREEGYELFYLPRKEEPERLILQREGKEVDKNE